MSRYVSFKEAKQQEPQWIKMVHEEIKAAELEPCCDHVAADVLWNLTAYPFGTEAEIRQQLREFFQKVAMERGPKP